MDNTEKIITYRKKGNNGQIEVRQVNESIWLSQKIIADLFDKDSDTIGLHIKNIYKEKELNKKSTTELFSVVQKEGKRTVSRKVVFYNLDMIISVGYRVNSKRGTQFRIWATKILKKHLLEGQTEELKMIDMKKIGEIAQRAIEEKDISINEAKGIVNVIVNYANTFSILNQFDNKSLKKTSSKKKVTAEIKYDEAILAIDELRKKLILIKEASGLFARQKDDGFKSILQSITQTFDNKPLYPTVEEQAAHLLYFVIKDHPFADGNKRIGAFLFIWFLQRNKHLVRKTHEAKINDNALVALALLVAQSDPTNKELMIKLIMNLINE